MNNYTKSLVAAVKFFSLAKCASKNGGFWVSSAGGTANVVAGVIARKTGVSYQQGHNALNVIGKEVHGDDWYQALYEENNQRERWDVATIAAAACR